MTRNTEIALHLNLLHHSQKNVATTIWREE